MPSANVSWPVPLVRQKPWFSGQFGVPGTDNERGLRSDCNGVVFYVDPNAAGVSDQRDGTDPEAPLATVGAALLLCQPYRGDVVAVMGNNSWQYGTAADGRILPVSEEVVVDVPGVRLVGVLPSGAMGVFWTPASNGGTCITIAALDVTVEGFAFTEGNFTGCNAISVLWNGTTAWGDNAVIRHCTFDDTVDTAIQLEFSWYCEISHNMFWECDAYGIYVDPAGSGIAYTTIRDNVFHDCTTAAMALRGSDRSAIYRNSIYNSNAQAGGAATDEGIDTTGGIENQVYDNYFSCILPVAAPGDWDDLNTGAVTDAWVGNHLTNGLAVTTPA